jgi:hypothetical protein
MQSAFQAKQRIRFVHGDMTGRGGEVKSVLTLDDGRQVLTVLPDGAAMTTEVMDIGVRAVIEEDEDTAEFAVPMWVDIAKDEPKDELAD